MENINVIIKVTPIAVDVLSPSSSCSAEIDDHKLQNFASMYKSADKAYINITIHLQSIKFYDGKLYKILITCIYSITNF